MDTHSHKYLSHLFYPGLLPGPSHLTYWMRFFQHKEREDVEGQKENNGKLRFFFEFFTLFVIFALR